MQWEIKGLASLWFSDCSHGIKFGAKQPPRTESFHFTLNDDTQPEWSPAAVWKQDKLKPMNQNHLEIPDPDTADPCLYEPWSLGGKLRRWGEKRVAGDKDWKKGVFENVCVCVLWSIPGPVSSVLSAAEAERPLHREACTVLARARHRQTAAIKPWLFQVHRVWKGLIEGLWSQWGWSFSPSPLPPPTSLSLTGRWGGGGGGLLGGWRHHVTHVSCWADQNGIWTKTHHLLLPACLWVPYQDSDLSAHHYFHESIKKLYYDIMV